jgi:hypothetical protein
MKGKRHIVGWIVLVIMAALLLAPGASANGYSPDAFERAVNAHNALSSNDLGSQPDRIAPPDAFERAVNAHNASLLDRSAQPQVEAAYPDAFERAVNARNASLANPDAFERAVNAHALAAAPAFGPSASGPDLVVGTDSSVPATGSSFDWDSAAIGGSATLALLLLVGTIVLATRGSRGRAVLR